MKSSALLIATVAASVLGFPSAHSQESISVGPFRNIELRGGGHVVLRRGPAQRVTLLRGSTRFTHVRVRENGQLVIDACNEDCPRQYDLEIEIVTPQIAGVAISGGGKIESERGFGRQEDIAAAVEGGGHIDIRSIDAERGDAAVNGGGLIDLRVERKLEAAVDGGGNIAYWGNPSVTPPWTVAGASTGAAEQVHEFSASTAPAR